MVHSVNNGYGTIYMPRGGFKHASLSDSLLEFDSDTLNRLATTAIHKKVLFLAKTISHKFWTYYAQFYIKLTIVPHK